MKKILTLVSFFLLLPTVSLAHQLQTDGSIGVVMHTDPDDAPPAGARATIYVDLTDLQHHFNGAACSCLASIMQGSKAIFQTPIFSKPSQGGTASDSFAYTFKDAGTYRVVLQGTPTNTGAFHPFLLSYEVEVLPVAKPDSGLVAAFFAFAGPHILHVLLAVFSALFVFCAALYERYIKPRKKTA